ncbi:MAG: D-2-hydroxyacid dehydrogenase [Planctomycetaceae bacterium]
MTLVIHPPLDPERLAAVRSAAAPTLSLFNADSPATALAAMPSARAFYGKLTPPLLAAAPRLEWVQAPTASLEHYLFPELIAHPCQLSNMRGLFSDVIAEHVLGVILCFTRNLHRYIRQQSLRLWQPVGGEEARTDFISGPGMESPLDRAHRHLSGQTLGLVGCGAIGAEVAQRAAAFGLRVIGVDPRVREIPDVVPTVWPPDELPRLLADSDFVVIAAPHTPATERLFRREQFQLMKRTAYLVNIGRGAIVELTDLVAALRAGELAGAALDVFETEPLPAEHPLWGLENVILTPHIAGVSTLVPQRHRATLVENIRRFSCGETPLNLVDKHLWC